MVLTDVAWASAGQVHTGRPPDVLYFATCATGGQPLGPKTQAQRRQKQLVLSWACSAGQFLLGDLTEMAGLAGRALTACTKVIHLTACA